MPQTEKFIRGLTQKDPANRLKLDEIKVHPYFKSINWESLKGKEIDPPFIPRVENGMYDISNFDEEITNKETSISPANPLTSSQNELFLNFSYDGNFNPIETVEDEIVVC